MAAIVGSSAVGDNIIPPVLLVPPTTLLVEQPIDGLLLALIKADESFF